MGAEVRALSLAEYGEKHEPSEHAGSYEPAQRGRNMAPNPRVRPPVRPSAADGF